MQWLNVNVIKSNHTHQFKSYTFTKSQMQKNWTISCTIRTVLWLGDWTLLKADERRLEAFHMNCQRQILGICWFHFITSQTGEEGLAIRICRRRHSIFGHVRRLPEATPTHFVLRLAVDTRAGDKPDIRPEWKRQRGRPCRTWVRQIEDDTGLNANDAWRIAHDRKSWRALRPVAGQAFHWLTDWLNARTVRYRS